MDNPHQSVVPNVTNTNSSSSSSSKRNSLLLPSREDSPNGRLGPSDAAQDRNQPHLIPSQVLGLLLGTDIVADQRLEVVDSPTSATGDRIRRKESEETSPTRRDEPTETKIVQVAPEAAETSRQAPRGSLVSNNNSMINLSGGAAGGIGKANGSITNSEFMFAVLATHTPPTAAMMAVEKVEGTVSSTDDRNIAPMPSVGNQEPTGLVLASPTYNSPNRLKSPEDRFASPTLGNPPTSSAPLIGLINTMIDVIPPSTERFHVDDLGGTVKGQSLPMFQQSQSQSPIQNRFQSPLPVRSQHPKVASTSDLLGGVGAKLSSLNNTIVGPSASLRQPTLSNRMLQLSSTDRSLGGGIVGGMGTVTVDSAASLRCAGTSSDVDSRALLKEAGSLGSLLAANGRPMYSNSERTVSQNPFYTPSQQSSAPLFLTGGGGSQRLDDGQRNMPTARPSNLPKRIDLSARILAKPSSLRNGSGRANGILGSLLVLLVGYKQRQIEGRFTSRLVVGAWSAPVVTMTFALYLSMSLAAAKDIVADHWWLLIAICLFVVFSVFIAAAQIKTILAAGRVYRSAVQRVADGEMSTQKESSEDHTVDVTNKADTDGDDGEEDTLFVSNVPRTMHYSFLLARLPYRKRNTRLFELATISHAILGMAAHFAHAVVAHKANVLSSVAEPVLVTYLIAPLALVCLGSRLRFRWLLLVAAVSCALGFWAGSYYDEALGFAVSREHLVFGIVAVIAFLFVAAAKEDVAREHFRRSIVVDQSLRALQHYTVQSKRLIGDLMPMQTLTRLLQGAPVLDTAKEVSTVCVEFCGSVDGMMVRTGSSILGAERLCVLVREIEEEGRRFKIDFANVSGDCYWGTCGLADSSLTTQHALKATHFALSVIGWHPYRGMDLRIGLHSGPMASTILGTSAQSLEVVGAGGNISWEVAASALPGTVLATDSFLLCLGKQVGPSVMDKVGNKFWRLQLQCTKLPVRVAKLEPSLLDGESVSPLLDLHGSPVGAQVEQFFDSQINPSLTMASQAAHLLRITRHRPFKLSREMAFNNKGYYYNSKRSTNKGNTNEGETEMMVKDGPGNKAGAASHTEWTSNTGGAFDVEGEVDGLKNNKNNAGGVVSTVENPLSGAPLSGPTNSEIAYDAMVIQYYSNRIARFMASLLVLALSVVTLALMLDADSDQPPGGIAVICAGLLCAGAGSLLIATVYPKRLQPAVFIVTLLGVSLFLVVLGLVLCTEDTKIRGNVSHLVLVFVFAWPTLSGIRIRLWSFAFTILAVVAGSLLLVAPFLSRPPLDGSSLPGAEPRSIDEAAAPGGTADTLSLFILCLLIPGAAAVWLEHYFQTQLHYHEAQSMMSSIHLTERSRKMLNSLLCMLVPQHQTGWLLGSYHLKSISKPIAVMDSRTLLIPREEIEDVAAAAEDEERERHKLLLAQEAKQKVKRGTELTSDNEEDDENNRSDGTMINRSMTLPHNSIPRPPLFPVYQWQRIPVCVMCINDLMSAQQILASDLFNQIAKVHNWIASSLQTCKNLTMLRTYGDVITIVGLGDMTRTIASSLKVLADDDDDVEVEKQQQQKQLQPRAEKPMTSSNAANSNIKVIQPPQSTGSATNTSYDVSTSIWTNTTNASLLLPPPMSGSVQMQLSNKESQEIPRPAAPDIWSGPAAPIVGTSGLPEVVSSSATSATGLPFSGPEDDVGIVAVPSLAFSSTQNSNQTTATGEDLHRQKDFLLATESNPSTVFSDAREVKVGPAIIDHAMLELVYIADTKRARTKQQRGGSGGGSGRGSYFSMRAGLHIGQACGTVIGTQRLTFDVVGPAMAVATRIARAAPKDRPLASDAFVAAYDHAMNAERERKGNAKKYNTNNKNPLLTPSNSNAVPAAAASASQQKKHNSELRGTSAILDNTATNAARLASGINLSTPDPAASTTTGARAPSLLNSLGGSSSDDEDLLPTFVDPNVYHPVVAEWGTNVVLQPKMSEWIAEPLMGYELIATTSL